MKCFYPVFVLCALLLPQLTVCRNETVAEEERRVNLWLQELDKSLVKRMYEDSVASWNYEANLTDYNLKLMNNLTVTSAKFYKVSSVGKRRRNDDYLGDE